MFRIGKNFDRIHDVVPGKHFYQFYKSPEDLLKVLLPYWQEGVRKGNFCFWVVADFMSVEEAKSFLAGKIEDLDRLILERRFELVPHVEWYGDGQTFDAELISAKYLNKIEEAIARGFSVIRLSGDNKVPNPALWSVLRDYERNFHRKAVSLPCIALCSYRIQDLGLQQTKDVVESHDGALVAHL